MTKHQRISKFIDDVRVNYNHISTEDLIILLTESKRIFENKIILDSLIQSLKSILAQDLSLKSSLTLRERQIVELIGSGKSNASISTYLNLSISTVETHRKNIRKKLNLKGKDSLFAFALVFHLQQIKSPQPK